MKAKKVISLLLCLVIVLSLSVTAFAMTNYVVRYARTNVNLRQQPVTTSTVLGVLLAAEKFNETEIDGDWSYGWPAVGTQIYEHYDGPCYGYVKSEYLF